VSVVLGIVWRNLLLYFRDGATVFFSMLGPIILFSLYVLFLGNLQATGLEQGFPDAGRSAVKAFVDSWMFAGIVLITTVTTGLGALAVLVDDSQSGRFRDFLVSPIRRGQLVLGYLISAVTIALTMSLVVLAVSILYLGFVSGVWLLLDSLLRIVAIVALCCMAFTSLSALIVSFVRTTGAYSALATIVGTLLGFIAGAYIPVGSLPQTVADVVNALPFGQAGVLLRHEFTAETLPGLTGASTEAEAMMRSVYGIDASVGEWVVPSAFIVVVLILLTVVCTALSSLRIRARIQ
jgi:multidrug/hemolysin transport system permease protein